MMNTDHWILLGAWALFSLLHSLTAAEWFREKCRKGMGRYFIYYRLLYSVFSFLSLGAVLAWQFTIVPVSVGPFPLLKWALALPAGLIGVLLMGSSIRKYFFNLSGISIFWRRTPTGSAKGSVTDSSTKSAGGSIPGFATRSVTASGAGEVLELGGLHRFIRHPLYLGTLLLVWSLFLFFPTLGNLIACGMITGYTLAGIRLEERKLLLQFGERYALYRKKVPMLIPGFRRAR